MREREAETQAEGEAGSMHQETDVGFDAGSPGSRPGSEAGAKPLRHPGIPNARTLEVSADLLALTLNDPKLLSVAFLLLDSLFLTLLEAIFFLRQRESVSGGSRGWGERILF